MKKLFLQLLAFFTVLTVSVKTVKASSYVVPPDIDDLRQSVRSSTIVPIVSDSPYRQAFTIYFNGVPQSVYFRCEAVPAITCRAGTRSVFVTLEKYQAFSSDSTPPYLAVSITGYDLKVRFDPKYNWYYICATLVTTDGNALLTEKNSKGGTAYDPNNPSNALVEVKQICK